MTYMDNFEDTDQHVLFQRADHLGGPWLFRQIKKKKKRRILDGFMLTINCPDSDISDTFDPHPRKRQEYFDI